MAVVTRPSMTDDSGTFTDGTVVGKTLLDQVFDQIDDQAHSTTNPNVKPKATTDEVVTARGSKASLDARLDIVLNEDGTLKTQPSLVTVSQVGDLLASINVAINGELDDWTAGGSLAPDGFTLSNLTVVRTGVAMGDTFNFGAGQYAAKLTRAGGIDGLMYQDVIAAGASFAALAACKGLKLAVVMKGQTAIANHLRITVDDGAATTSSTYHTGGDTPEDLGVVHTISNSATRLRVEIEVKGSNGDAYCGGFGFAFSPVALNHWIPLSTAPDASAIRRGLVSVSDQQLGAGVKTVGSKQALTKLENTSDTIRLSGVLAAFCDFTDHAITSATIQDSGYTKTFQAAALQVGNVLRVTVGGTSSGNQNVARLVSVSFGGTEVNVINQQATNALSGEWRGVAEIAITGAATQRMVGDGLLASATIINIPDYNTASVAISGAIILKTRLNPGHGSETITQTMAIVEVL